MKTIIKYMRINMMITKIELIKLILYIFYFVIIFVFFYSELCFSIVFQC